MVDGVIPAGSRPTVLWLLRELLREPLSRRTWAEFRYVIASLPVAIVGFAFTVVTTAVGVVSFGLLVGPPLLALSSPGARGLAAVSRGLAGRLLGTRVAPPPPFRPRPGLVGWIRSGITDAAGWRARAYLMLKLPVAAAGYLVAGWTWLGGLSGLTYPLRWEILDRLHVHDGVNPLPGSLTTPEGNLVVVPLGVALLLAAPWLTRAVVSLDGVLIARLIGPMSLTERVRNLEQTRAHAVDDSAARLRRIERDLHDGAQAQMIAVAMTISNDLAEFDKRFGYPAPPSFKIIAPAGKIPAYNAGNPDMVGSAGETTLDVDYAHALALDANILLVETPVDETAGTAGFPQIIAAEKYVIDHGLGDVISQSFSTAEETFTSYRQLEPLRAAYLDAYVHRVTVLAGTSDSGATDTTGQGTYYTSPVTSWPDTDPLVTGVGGTQLKLSGGTYTSVAWNDTYNTAVNEYFGGVTGPNPAASGGGASEFFTRPAYQDGVRSEVGAKRGTPDISMSGAANGAVWGYHTFGGLPPGWSLDSGTSEATPEFAAIVALADQVAGHRLGLLNPRLYALSARHAPGIVDVTSGNNTVSFRQGTANNLYTVQGYPARKGYDLVTGLGTIDAPPFVYELAGR